MCVEVEGFYSVFQNDIDTILRYQEDFDSILSSVL